MDDLLFSTSLPCGLKWSVINCGGWKEPCRSLVQPKSPGCYSGLSIATQVYLLQFVSWLPSWSPELTCYLILLAAEGVTGHCQQPDTTVGIACVRGTLFVSSMEQPCSYCAFLTISVRKLLRSCSSEQQRAGEWKAMAADCNRRCSVWWEGKGYSPWRQPNNAGGAKRGCAISVPGVLSAPVG